jgi:hypothetical protein
MQGTGFLYFLISWYHPLKTSSCLSETFLTVDSLILMFMAGSGMPFYPASTRLLV